MHDPGASPRSLFLEANRATVCRRQCARLRLNEAAVPSRHVPARRRSVLGLRGRYNEALSQSHVLTMARLDWSDDRRLVSCSTLRAVPNSGTVHSDSEDAHVRHRPSYWPAGSREVGFRQSRRSRPRNVCLPFPEGSESARKWPCSSARGCPSLESRLQPGGRMRPTDATCLATSARGES